MENEIFQTENFIVEAHAKPFITRTEGGHIRIRVKDEKIFDRTKLSSATAIELMRLTMIVGEALQTAMNKNGIPVIKINYHDMGNWAYKEGKLPFLHVHIFGRTADAVKQPWPESMYLPDRKTGFYDNFEPLNHDDIVAVREEIVKILQDDKYQDDNWRPGNNIVAGVVIKQNDKYLLVQENCPDSPTVHGKWNFPAGHVDGDETIEQAAVKEAKEESGYEVELISKLGIFQDKVSVPAKHAFEARILGGKISWPPDEILHVKWFSLSEIKDMKDQLRGSWILDAINILEEKNKS